MKVSTIGVPREIKEQEQLYTRLRASQSCEELERKVRLYEERKAQSGTP